MELLQQIINGIAIGSVYSLVGMGFSLVFGIMRVLNFAYGEFFMLACYSTYFLYSLLGLPVPLIMLINMVVFFALGIVIEKGLVKPVRKGEDWMPSVIISTMGLQIVLQTLALLLWTGRYQGVPYYVYGSLEFGPFIISRERVLIFLTSFLLIILMLVLVNKTRLGMSMRAVTQNIDSALLVGVNVQRVYMITMGISSALIALAGTMLLPQYNAYPTVGARPIMKAFAVTLLGGMGHINGAIVAGFILGIAEALAGAYISSLAKDGVAFIVMILILILYPGGVKDFFRRSNRKKVTSIAK